MLPLEGIRVVDFGRVLSAPYGTMQLADLGADVVKIEHPKYGDDTRSFGPPFVRDEYILCKYQSWETQYCIGS